MYGTPTKLPKTKHPSLKTFQIENVPRHNVPNTKCSKSQNIQLQNFLNILRPSYKTSQVTIHPKLLRNKHFDNIDIYIPGVWETFQKLSIPLLVTAIEMINLGFGRELPIIVVPYQASVQKNLDLKACYHPPTWQCTSIIV
jgi:hypothetical protein